MSRSGYSDDIDESALNLWRGAVESAIRGKRGQAFLRELLADFDAMPVKELVANDFQVDGQFCTLGVIADKRGVDVSDIDPEDEYTAPKTIAKRLGIARSMAAEIMFENDEPWAYRKIAETPTYRWIRMRRWIAEQIKESKP